MFNVANWYWVIAGSATEVYSSATNTMVPTSDPGYTAWAADNIASTILNEAELAEVMQGYGLLPAWLFLASGTFIQPTPTTYTNAQLAAYSANIRYNRASGGVIITSLSPVPFLTDPVSRNTVDSANSFMTANPAATLQWKMSDGSWITVDKAKVATMNNDIADFIHKCFDCESSTASSINGGTITTLAQIDSAFAAISNVYP